MKEVLRKEKTAELGKDSSLLKDLHKKIESNPLHEHNVLPLLFGEPGFRFGTVTFQGYVKKKTKKEVEEASISPLFAIAHAKRKVSVNWLSCRFNFSRDSVRSSDLPPPFCSLRGQ